MTAPTRLAPPAVIPQVGWERSDEEGWLMVAEVHYDEERLEFMLIDRHGGEHWKSLRQMVGFGPPR